MRHNHRRIERHHILHEAAVWEAQDEYKKLRRSVGMVALLDSEYHRPVLHANVPPVPLPPRQIADRASKLYVPDTNNLDAIDNMCFAIAEASRQVALYALETDQSFLTIEALRLQREYVKQGQL